MKVFFIVMSVLMFVGCGTKAGPAGAPGADGKDGASGTSCSVQELGSSFEYPNGGALISCGSSVVVVKNGSDGAQGLAGANATSVTPVSFCPVANHTFAEYGLKIGSELYAVYAKGQKIFLTKLVAGYTYQTTDGYACQFTYNSDGSFTY